MRKSKKTDKDDLRLLFLANIVAEKINALAGGGGV